MHLIEIIGCLKLLSIISEAQFKTSITKYILANITFFFCIECYCFIDILVFLTHCMVKTVSECENFWEEFFALLKNFPGFT